MSLNKLFSRTNQSKHRRPSTSKLTFERLENRQLMAADVSFIQDYQLDYDNDGTADVVGDAIVITGDDLANYAEVSRDQNGRVEVVTGDATRHEDWIEVVQGRRLKLTEANSPNLVFDTFRRDVSDVDFIVFEGLGGRDVFKAAADLGIEIYAWGGDDNDYLEAGNAQDRLYGEAGFDALIGGAESDWLDGGNGVDLLLAGEGDPFAEIWGVNSELVVDLQVDPERVDDATYDSDLWVIYHTGSGYYDPSSESNSWHGAGLERLYGGEGDDIIFGGGANFLIHGGAGNDRLYAGGGGGALHGDEGNDVLWGAGGSDYLHGGAGNDSLYGDYYAHEQSDDQLYGGEGDDSLSGGGGNDDLFGGEGDDFLSGGAGNDDLYGEAGHDLLFGETSGGMSELIDAFREATDSGFGIGFERTWALLSPQLIDGLDSLSGGSDSLWGGDDHDLLFGGGGIDYLHGDDGINAILGGSGSDWIYADGGTLFARGGDGVDRIYGGNNADHLYGDKAGDYIYGRSGDDIIRGGEGDDRLYGENGFDIISGDAGSDRLYGGYDASRDVLFGDKAIADVEYAANYTAVDSLVRSRVVGAGATSEQLETALEEYETQNDGRDYLYGYAGNDIIVGGGGNDYISASSGDDWIFGGSGVDRIYGHSGNDTAYGGSGNDEIWEEAWGRSYTGNDVIYGGSGNDDITGGKGHDTIFGEAGNDVIRGGDGHDSLFGGGGFDQIFGDAGMDYLEGGNDGFRDYLNGGAGADVFMQYYQWQTQTITYTYTIGGRRISFDVTSTVETIEPNEVNLSDFDAVKGDIVLKEFV